MAPLDTTSAAAVPATVYVEDGLVRMSFLIDHSRSCRSIGWFLLFLLVTCLLNTVESSVEPDVLKNQTVCLSKGCVKAAASILQSVDWTVDPCEDFYGFSCGRFKERHFLRGPERPSISAFDLRFMGHVVDLNILLRRSSPTWNPLGRTLKEFFDGCRDSRTVEGRGAEPLLRALEKLGKWPSFSGKLFESEPFDWQRRNHEAREAGFDWSFFFSTEVTEFSNNVFNIHIELPSQVFSSCHYVDDVTSAGTFFSRFILFVVKILKLDLDMKSDGEQLLNFFLAIFPFTLKKRDYLEEEHRPFLLRDLYGVTSEVDWKNYLGRVFRPRPIGFEEVVLMRNSTRHFLATVLPSLLRRPKRVVANYMLFRLIASVNDHLPRGFHVTDDPELARFCLPKESRSDYCLKLATHLMPLHYSVLFSAKHLNKRKRTAIINILIHIRNQVKNILRQVPWIGNSTLYKMNERLIRMKFKLFPYGDQNGTDAQRFQNWVHIRRNYHFENVLSLKSFQSHLLIDRFLPEGFTREKYMTMLEGGFALYDHELNEISVFPMVYKSVFFNEDRPKSMNYATLGFIIAHEILHGITMYDVDFGSTDDIFWDRRSFEEQQLRSRCLLHHFSRYFYRPMKIIVDGEKSLFENIADNEGIGVAYQAYEEWSRKYGRGRDLPLPGLPFNPRQLFWVGAALPFCSVDSRRLPQFLLTGPHLHGRFRILAMVTNNGDFGRDFNCAKDSPMHPRLKCKLWT